DFTSLKATDGPVGPMPGLPFDYQLGARHLYADAGGLPLFTFNETNNPRIWGPSATSRKPFVKDAFHQYVVEGHRDAVNSEPTGTKACFHYAALNVPAGSSVVVRLRLSDKLFMSRSATLTTSWRRGGARPTSSTRRFIRRRRARTSGAYSGRRSPGCSGRNRFTSTT